jgi:flagellar basal-body rod protein FlgF
MPTRAFVVDNTVGADFSSGAMQVTGRDLDVAVKGKGWIAVQNADGTESYTRNGALQVSPNGILQTSTARPSPAKAARSRFRPIPRSRVGADGTISTMSTTTTAGPPTVLGRIKLVNPNEADLVRGDDGLFRLKDGSQAQADPAVTVAGGALEGSNVSAVDRW